MSLGPSHTQALKDEHHREQDQRLRRSPHPYSRRSFDVPERLQLNRQSRPNPLELSADRFPRANRRNYVQKTTAGLVKSKENHTSPSDSGTEADDERPLLKALTAPPLRPRKGLKSAKGSTAEPFASPLPTPSTAEDEGKTLQWGQLAGKGQNLGQWTVKQRSGKENTRRKRYGRAEFLRRALEATLLAAVGYINLFENEGDVIRTILWHALLVASICSTYLLRLALHSFAVSKTRPVQNRFWLPPNVDPAPLLYPVFLPLFVSWTMQPRNPHALISNCILSVASLPRKAIPWGDYYLHWTFSLIPLAYEKMAESYGLTSNLFPGQSLPSRTAREEQALIFPLHCALLQALGFLTTTSLLPTELQLLSVSLVNSLHFGTSSQSQVLKGLLWVGGVALVASCRHVLQWSVELARVPSWRFRRKSHHRAGRSTVLCALDDTFGDWLGNIVRSHKSRDSSDDELTPGVFQRHRAEKFPGRIEVAGLPSRNARRASGASSASLDDLAYSEKGTYPTTDRDGIGAVGSRRRRHTLPTNLTPLADIPALTKTATDALSSARLRSKLLVRLTAAQAAVLKWLYAAFVYVMVIAIIFVPVRLFIGSSALNGKEPVGWALGYLFGDLDNFRFRVVYFSLERWICLPERYAALEEYPGLGEQLRLSVFGPANTRLLICGWCVANIVTGLVAVFRLSNVVEVDTRRKVFHGMMVSMFLPAIFIDPAFAALAFALILAIFLLLDLFRAAQLPPLSKPLTHFLAPYVDGRDHRGPIIISHIFLLIGCAIPLWLSLADVKRTGKGAFKGWDVESRDISMVTGVICVGMGDAAASLIGRRYGHRRWAWSGGKSLEGSAAFALAVTVGLMASRLWLLVGGWKGDNGDAWLTTLTKSTIAASGASLTEAVLTGGNDNVVVPIILWLWVRGLHV